jgi:hypothetical protein
MLVSQARASSLVDLYQPWVALGDMRWIEWEQGLRVDLCAGRPRSDMAHLKRYDA